jgi:homopolymeric O-antigen transport system ATP-binding protein
MEEPIIKVENLGKQYRLGSVGTGTLSHDINRWWHKVRGKEDPYLKVGDVNDRTSAGGSDYVWALKDVNFEVKPGEILGIIGKNGAGKSTLLKLLSRVTAPTTGKITCHGRIASLLEVGTGFHPELTGKENIFLNGAILGMSKKEIASKFDEIVDFAGCAKYINTPVKRYSSGMYVRLAFAVAAHLEPDILVVDEVLAVGDAEFQKKAIGKMQEVSEGQGRTVLFVSHNLKTIEMLCQRSILMNQGSIEMIDKTPSVLTKYQEDLLSGSEWKRLGTQQVIFTDYITKSSNVELGEDFTINLKLKQNQAIKGVSISIDVRNASNEFIAHISNADDQFTCIFDKSGNAEVEVTLKDVNLAPGNYMLSIWAGTNFGENFDYIENCLSMRVVQTQNLIKRTTPYDKRSNVVLASNWQGR